MNETGSHRVLVAGNIPPELRARLATTYELVALADATAGDAIAVAVTTSMDGASAEFMAQWPRLGLIACNGAGTDRIDLNEAARLGIAVCNTPDAVTTDTADFALGLAFAVSRGIVAGDRFVRAGRWTAGKMAPSTRVRGKRLGIVGFGKIGSTIAFRAEAIGLEVSYCTRRRLDRSPFAYFGSVTELAAASDILILACPGGEATRHLVDAGVLAALGPNGYLINIARGSVVDELALLDALERGAIAGAGLDVFENEPAINERFLGLDNVILTPHCAAVTHETRADMAQTLFEAISDHFRSALRPA